MTRQEWAITAVIFALAPVAIYAKLPAPAYWALIAVMTALWVVQVVRMLREELAR